MKQITSSAPVSHSPSPAGSADQARRTVDVEDPLPFWEWVLSLPLLVLLVATLLALLDPTSTILALRAALVRQSAAREDADQEGMTASSVSLPLWGSPWRRKSPHRAPLTWWPR